MHSWPSLDVSWRVPLSLYKEAWVTYAYICVNNRSLVHAQNLSNFLGHTQLLITPQISNYRSHVSVSPHIWVHSHTWQEALHPRASSLSRYLERSHWNTVSKGLSQNCSLTLGNNTMECDHIQTQCFQSFENGHITHWCSPRSNWEAKSSQGFGVWWMCIFIHGSCILARYMGNFLRIP